VTGGRFLSMTSATTHSRWPLWQPSWILFPSIIWRTPGSTGPIFLWLYWGWLEECSFQWPVPLLIQDGCCGSYLGFDFRRLSDKHLGRLVLFLGGRNWGDWRMSIISAATYSRWPPQQLSWIWFPTNTSVDWSDFLVAYWGWLEVSSCRGSALPLIQDGSHLGFGCPICFWAEGGYARFAVLFLKNVCRKKLVNVDLVLQLIINCKTTFTSFLMLSCN
jgi:hypothetical protein